ALHQVEQDTERLLLEAVRCLYPAHMVDRIANRNPVEHGCKFRQIHSVKVQVDMPLQRRDHSDDAFEHIHIGNAAKMTNEVKPAAPKAALVQLLKTAFGDRLVDVCYSSISSGTHRDRVESHTIVDPMHTRVDNHGAFGAEFGV